MFGTFNHDIPDGSYREPPFTPEEWQRPDFADLLVAWFDRYLKQLPTGVENWPVVQLQGTDGQWRAEPDWPSTGGPAGQLGLEAGRLDAVAPRGSTSYTEGFFEPKQGRQPGTFAAFETARLPERLQLTGQAVLDVWVSLDKPDAHLAARLEALDPGGRPIDHAFTTGLRSLRHLDPLVENRFAQAEGKPAPVGAPVRVPLRFQPSELVVPKGGKLRLTLSGSQIVRGGLETLTGAPVSVFEGPSALSGSATRVTVLHDCAHPSALRFLMPRTRPDLLNVREEDEPAGRPLADNRPFEAPVSTGGIARRNLCGRGPIDPQSVESGRGCLARRSPIGPRNIGRVRLGYSRRGLLRLSVQPFRRTRRSYRYCVKRSSGRVSAVFSRRGRVALIATTARSHGNRGVRPGASARALRRAYARRQAVGRGLYRANRSSPRLIGIRKGRVRFVAVADRALLRSRRALRRYLRLALLDPAS
jgi:hypothetical protein